MMTTGHAVIASAILTFLMLMVASAMTTRVWTSSGLMLAFGNRDNLPVSLGAAGRADRAAGNMIDGMVLLLAAVLAAQLAGKGAEAATGATVFFWARLVYWPVYAAGIVFLRTLVWLLSIVGIAMILLQAW